MVYTTALSTSDLTKCGSRRKLELTNSMGLTALRPLPKEAVMNTSFLRVELVGERKKPVSSWA